MATAKISDLLTNGFFYKDITSDMSSRQISDKWGVGKSSVNDWRRKNQPATQHGQTIQHGSDGSRVLEGVRDRAVTLADARAWIESSGDDPDLFDISVRSIAYGEGLWSNRMSATPKKGVKPGATITVEDYEKASKYIENFIYIPPKREFLVGSSVIVAADNQLGKEDFNGGSDSTIERALCSYANAVEYVKEYRPKHVVLAHPGDGIENCNNTSSQRDTNDLDIPHQVLAMFKLELEGIRMLASHSPKMTAAFVPSNHGRARAGLKQDMGTPHADYGIANAKMIAHTLEVAGSFGNVDVQIPKTEWHESLTVYTDAVNVGLVHGHQASGADKLGDWWAKQDHGRQPTWDADVLISGHWHSYRGYQSGDQRWVFVGPANEPGSSWYTNLKGETSTTGMLAMSFNDPKQWMFQEIL